MLNLFSMSVEELSVFFPAFNEEANLTSTVEKALEVLEGLKLKRYEVIIINDGSKDTTAEVAEKLAKKYKEVRVINHPQNKGYGEALKSGFYNAKYDWITFNDSDGQFDFAEISKFIEKAEEAEVVVGYRVNRQDNFVRKLNGWGWTFISNLLLGINVKDVDCAFKLIKKSVIEKIPKLKSTRGGMISPELLALIRKDNFKIVEVGVHHYQRKAGEQTGANLKVIITSFLELFKLWWILLDKKIFFGLVCILGLAAFLRLYRLPEYMTFLGDEGRDALVIKDLLVNHHFPFIGPPTSIGNIYLGPLYYYMMTVPMVIFWLNPIAAAYQIAIIGVLTVFLIYFLTRQWFGEKAGLVASLLYAISPVNIIYSRSSWNPNPAPFFALLAVFSLWKIDQTRNFLWLVLTGIALAFAIQMHYLALILVPICGVIWAHQIIYGKYAKWQRSNITRGTILGISAFLILMSPLVIFDLRHNFMNFRALQAFFSNRETTVNLNPLNTLSRIVPIYKDILIGHYLAAQNYLLTVIVSVLVVLPFILVFLKKVREKTVLWPYMMLAVWLGGALLGLALYKQNIYDHYLGFVNPTPFILLGSLYALSISVSELTGRWLQITGVIFIGILVVVNLQKSPLLSPPNRQIERTQEITRYVIDQSKGLPFNFALLSKNNYDSAYQFYLELYGYKPKQVPFTITDQLFVVCEDPVCEPINNPKYEIAAFGWAKIAKENNFLGVKVYKLVHNTIGKR